MEIFLKEIVKVFTLGKSPQGVDLLFTFTGLTWKFGNLQ